MASLAMLLAIHITALLAITAILLTLHITALMAITAILSLHIAAVTSRQYI
jgi:hypothetical protein